MKKLWTPIGCTQLGSSELKTSHHPVVVKCISTLKHFSRNSNSKYWEEEEILICNGHSSLEELSSIELARLGEIYDLRVKVELENEFTNSQFQ